MILADTELDSTMADAMPDCCVENYVDFQENAGMVAVEAGQELICPTCGGYTILDSDGRWRYAGDG